MHPTILEQFKKDLKEKDYTETQREQIEQTIEDTEYQVRTAKEIVNVLKTIMTLR